MGDKVRPTRISLSEDERDHSIDLLNSSLANTLFAVLASKFAHWNVKGEGFFPTHELFDKIYGFYSESADTIAERITALGGTANGMLTDVAIGSTIDYGANAYQDVDHHIKAMADMLGQVANEYRVNIDQTEGDMATQDVFIQLARDADKFIYFLEAGLRTS